MKIECVYCHAKALTGERAGFPSASKCMICHREVAKGSETIQRLAALAGDTLIVPQQPLYELPDFVVFSHARHKTQQISCATCHGDVWVEDIVKVQLRMKMKACIDCHKTNHATVVCNACHELTQ